ncbi:hypothetical protein DFH09DRAFT_1368753 [Mycena vulgaris]|nr:hypothetical protein DFH09DRAFT_1368753 [Mycena vulgaris]
MTDPISIAGMSGAALSFGLGSAPQAIQMVSKFQWTKTPTQLNKMADERLAAVMEILSLYGKILHNVERLELTRLFWELKSELKRTQESRNCAKGWENLTQISHARREAQTILRNAVAAESFAKIVSEKARFRQEYLEALEGAENVTGTGNPPPANGVYPPALRLSPSNLSLAWPKTGLRANRSGGGASGSGTSGSGASGNSADVLTRVNTTDTINSLSAKPLVVPSNL